MKRDSLVKCAKDGKSVGLLAHVKAPYVMGADLVLQDFTAFGFKCWSYLVICSFLALVLFHLF